MFCPSERLQHYLTSCVEADLLPDVRVHGRRVERPRAPERGKCIGWVSNKLRQSAAKLKDKTPPEHLTWYATRYTSSSTLKSAQTKDPSRSDSEFFVLSLPRLEGMRYRESRS